MESFLLGEGKVNFRKDNMEELYLSWVLKSG